MNMKPPELLGLMEEAAGTRMFELKKLQAKKTMEKKDMKLAEINKVICIFFSDYCIHHAIMTKRLMQ